jgi:hypothetical protein
MDEREMAAVTPLECAVTKKQGGGGPARVVSQAGPNQTLPLARLEVGKLKGGLCCGVLHERIPD